MARWHYQGDVSLEHGGTFFDLSEWNNGYVNAVEVTDLDSGCGFDGATLIEERTVIVNRQNAWADALSTVGASLLPNGDINDNGRTLRKDTRAWRMCLAYALNAYGLYDTGRSEVVQPDRSCPTEYGGWSATRIRANSLRSYVRKQFLGLAR